MYTKTEQTPESDEESVYADKFFSNLFELYTKTKEERESEEDSESALRYNDALFDLI
jgi:hypothetical protein